MIVCPICHQSQEIIKKGVLNYPTRHPLFASCQIAFCKTCESGWVANPPVLKDLKKYYDMGAYGRVSLLNLLKKQEITLERCQALARWRFILTVFEKTGLGFAQKPFSVCDIGAGFGCTLEVGRHIGLSLDYFAYESASGMRRRINSLGGRILPDFFEDDQPGQFDLVWASHILEHYSNPDDLFKKMRRMILHGGVGFVETPCLDNEFKLDLAPHLLFFTKQGMQKVLERNGFKILALDSVGNLRSEAGQHYRSENNKHTLRKKLKKLFKKRITLESDLQSRSIFGRWDLETYGGERCWIRVIFTVDSD